MSGVGAAGASSLVNSSRMASEDKVVSVASRVTPDGWRGGWAMCPRRTAMRGYDCETGALWAMTCGANICPYCIETNIWQTSRAFAHSAPTRYVVFTGIPSDDWDTNRLKIKALHKRLDRAGYDVRSAYSIEAGDRTGMVHLNLWWWSACCPSGGLCRSGCKGYIPQEVLVEAALSMGWGPVTDVRRWHSKRANYGMKEASGSSYGMKEARSETLLDERGPRCELSPRQEAFLQRNGGRLLGARPSFWRDGEGGAPLGSKRATLEVLKAAEARKQGREQWVVFAGSEVLAHSPVVSSPASVTSITLPGSRFPAEPLPPGSPWVSDPFDLAVASTLRSSRRAMTTSTGSARTAPSTDPVRASTRQWPSTTGDPSVMSGHLASASSCLSPPPDPL